MGAESRFDLGPALQQASALPTEPRCTLQRICTPALVCSLLRRRQTQSELTVTGEFPYFTALSQEFSYIRSVGGGRGLISDTSWICHGLTSPQGCQEFAKLTELFAKRSCSTALPCIAARSKSHKESKSIGLPLKFQ